MDETQKRLTVVETMQAETKIILQGLATQTEMRNGFEKVNVALEKIVGRLLALEAVMPHMATKADIGNLQASMIKWVVGTGLGCMTLAVAIAKLLA